MSTKKELKRPDQVQHLMERALNTASDNMMPIALGLAVVFLVALVGVGVDYYQEKGMAQQNLYYARASRLIEQGMAVPATTPNRFDEGEKILDQLYNESRGDDIFPFVLARLSDMYTAQGQYKAAISVLNELVELSNVDPIVLDAAYYRLVKLYEADYNVPQAIRTASKAIETVGGPFSVLLKAEMERMSGGSLNEELTHQLRAERVSSEDLAPSTIAPLNLDAR